jgi:predicted RND superfamily exporter protein
VIRRRGVVLAALALSCVALGAGALRMESDFTPDDLFRGIEGQGEIAAEFEQAFGNTDNVALLLVEADDVLRPDVLQYVHDTTLHFREAPFADHVVSITTMAFAGRSSGRLHISPAVSGDTVSPQDAEALAAAIAATPLIEGKLIARDRTVVVVAVILRRGAARLEQLRPAIDAMRAWTRDHPLPSGARVRLGGLPYIRVYLISKMEADQGTLFPAAFIVCLLVLLATFRWIPALVLPPIAVGMSALMLIGAMAWLGEPLNIVNNVVPILIIVIGLSDSIHLLNRYGERLAAGSPRDEASRLSLRSMVAACFLTSLTTAIGFGALAVSELDILRRFGITAAAGVLVAYVVTITFLPAALTFVRTPKRPIADHKSGRIEQLLEPTVRWVLRHRAIVLVTASALLAGSVVAARTLPVDTAVHEQYDADDPNYQTLQLMETKLDGVRPVEISLSSPQLGRFDDPALLDALDRVQRWARQQPGVISATGYADLLRQTWVAITGEESKRTTPFERPEQTRLLAGLLETGAAPQARTFVTLERTHSRISIQMRDIGGRATLAFAKALRVELDRELAPFPDVRAELTGEGYVSAKGLDVVTRDLLASLLLAVVVIFAVMTVLFRSLRLGLLSIPPNLLPLVFTMAYMKARGIPLNTATVIIFSISIGLAVDGTIHMLARFIEETRSGKDRDQALLESARGTGKAVVASYLSLMVGFAVLQLSAFVPVRKFGELISVTAFGCLVATVVMLPALLGVAWREETRG